MIGCKMQKSAAYNEPYLYICNNICCSMIMLLPIPKEHIIKGIAVLLIIFFFFLREKEWLHNPISVLFTLLDFHATLLGNNYNDDDDENWPPNFKVYVLELESST